MRGMMHHYKCSRTWKYLLQYVLIFCVLKKNIYQGVEYLIVLIYRNQAKKIENVLLWSDWEGDTFLGWSARNCHSLSQLLFPYFPIDRKSTYSLGPLISVITCLVTTSGMNWDIKGESGSVPYFPLANRLSPSKHSDFRLK